MILAILALATCGAFATMILACSFADSRVQRALVELTDEEAIAILATTSATTSATSATTSATSASAHLACPRLAIRRVAGLIAY